MLIRHAGCPDPVAVDAGAGEVQVRATIASPPGMPGLPPGAAPGGPGGRLGLYEPTSGVPEPAAGSTCVGGVWCDLWAWTLPEWDATPERCRPAAGEHGGDVHYLPGVCMLWVVPRGDYPRPWDDRA